MAKAENAGDQHFLLFSKCCLINSFTKRQNFGLVREFKAFADDKIIVTQKLKYKSKRVKNIMGKGENVFESFLFQRC